MLLAGVTPKDYSLEGNLTGRALVSRGLQAAAQLGATVVRTWAHTHDAEFPFQARNNIPACFFVHHLRVRYPWLQRSHTLAEEAACHTLALMLLARAAPRI